MMERLSVKGKQAVFTHILDFMNANGAEHDLAIDTKFAQAVYNTVEESDCYATDSDLTHLLDQEGDWIERFVAFQIMVDNPNKRSWIKMFYRDAEVHGVSFSQFEKDNSEEEKKALGKLNKKSKEHDALNFMRYNMAPALEYFRDDPEAPCKARGYVKMFGKRIPLNCHLQTSEKTDPKYHNFEAMNMEFNKDNVQLAKAVLRAMGVKKAKELGDDIDDLNKAINTTFAEYFDVLDNHEDGEYAMILNAWEYNHDLYMQIVDFAKERAKLDYKDIKGAVSCQKVLDVAATTVNRQFRDDMKSPIGFDKTREFPYMITKMIEDKQFTEEDLTDMVDRWFSEAVVFHAITWHKAYVPGTEWPAEDTYVVPRFEQHHVGKEYNDEEE
jgi:hypothetical protein